MFQSNLVICLAQHLILCSSELLLLSLSTSFCRRFNYGSSPPSSPPHLIFEFAHIAITPPPHVFPTPYPVLSGGLRVVHTSQWSRWLSLLTVNNETLVWMRYSTLLSNQNRSNCWWTNMNLTPRWHRKVSTNTGTHHACMYTHTLIDKSCRQQQCFNQLCDSCWLKGWPAGFVVAASLINFEEGYMKKV